MKQDSSSQHKGRHGAHIHSLQHEGQPAPPCYR
jgi:hypothetical protein